jgi:hypothetical protein
MQIIPKGLRTISENLKAFFMNLSYSNRYAGHNKLEGQAMNFDFCRIFLSNLALSKSYSSNSFMIRKMRLKQSLSQNCTLIKTFDSQMCQYQDDI